MMAFVLECLGDFDAVCEEERLESLEEIINE